MPHLSAHRSTSHANRFPRSPSQSVGPPGPLSRVHWCIHPCRRVNYLRNWAGQTARVKSASPVNSCMRLHKRSSRLGRGRPRKALHGWLVTTVQGRLCSLLAGYPQWKCLPSCNAVRGLAALRSPYLASSGRRRRANLLARGINGESHGMC